MLQLFSHSRHREKERVKVLGSYMRALANICHDVRVLAVPHSSIWDEEGGGRLLQGGYHARFLNCAKWVVLFFAHWQCTFIHHKGFQKS